MKRLCTLIAATVAVALVVPIHPAGAQTPAAGTATTWFFAEGNTLPHWYEFLVLINPDANNDVSVHVEYQLEAPAGVAQPGKTQDVVVNAGQRSTIAVYDAVGSGYTGVSAKLTSSQNFVAERPIYFINTFDIGEVNGAHDALGVNTASKTWYFAEGSTLLGALPFPGPVAGNLRGFMPFWTMQNVSGQDATVSITYYASNPNRVVERTITVKDGTRVTTDIANAFDDPAYPGALGPNYEGFGTVIESDQPIIVERPFYVNRDFPGIGPVNAATNERGALSRNNTTWLFATSNVTIEYDVEGQTSPTTKTLSVGARSRKTVEVYEESSPGSLGVGGGLGRNLAMASAPNSAGVSVRLKSTNGVGIVAERPMYFIHDFGNGLVNGAHDVLGAGAADASWFFAEGTLRSGFFEFVTIQNPSPSAAMARLDYFVSGQAIQTGLRDLPPNSRVTVTAYDSGSARRSPGAGRPERHRLRLAGDVGSAGRRAGSLPPDRRRTAPLREHADRRVGRGHQRRA